MNIIYQSIIISNYDHSDGSPFIIPRCRYYIVEVICDTNNLQTVLFDMGSWTLFY